MPEDKERQELKKLPSVEGLEAEARKEVMMLLECLDELMVKKAELALQEDNLKDRLEELQKQLKLPGFRHGWLTFRAQPVAGRRTLDKMLLLENGCPASALNLSYKEGQPSTRVTFKHLSEEED
jgi:hypothetical protein